MATKKAKAKSTRRKKRVWHISLRLTDELVGPNSRLIPQKDLERDIRYLLERHLEVKVRNVIAIDPERERRMSCASE